jgi:hypothetical protein
MGAERFGRIARLHERQRLLGVRAPAITRSLEPPARGDAKWKKLRADHFMGTDVGADCDFHACKAR